MILSGVTAGIGDIERPQPHGLQRLVKPDDLEPWLTIFYSAHAQRDVVHDRLLNLAQYNPVAQLSSCAPFREGAAAEQGDEADEAKHIGASQLIPGVRRTEPCIARPTAGAVGNR